MHETSNVGKRLRKALMGLTDERRDLIGYHAQSSNALTHKEQWIVGRFLDVTDVALSVNRQARQARKLH